MPPCSTGPAEGRRGSKWAERIDALIKKSIMVGLLVSASANVQAADEIYLHTGEILKGQIIAKTPAALQVQHDILGKILIPFDRINQVVEDDVTPKVETPAAEADKKAAEQAQAAKAVAEAAKPPEPPAPQGFFSGWKSKLELGFNGSEGNSDILNLYAAFKSEKADKSDRWRYDASYFLSESDGVNTKNQFTTGLLKDWFIPDSRWFFFAEGRFDIDEFKSWDYRASVAAGPGYKLIDEENLKITLRAGAGGAKEWGSEDDEFRPEANAGGELAWNITPKSKIAAATRFYPSLEDPADFRVVSSAEWVYKLEENISLKFGVEDEYESEVDSNREKNDIRYYGAIVFEF